MSKVTKACSVSTRTRRLVIARDKYCIFCGQKGTDIMHYISRGRLGLGIVENLALGCRSCHMLLDQSKHKSIMREHFKKYLDDLYPEFSDENRMFKK